jgi:aryl-alcohol dehydrogenase-like predicted oxidoreductase
MMTRRECLQRMAGAGAMLAFNPAYGASEEVAGRIAQELGIAQRLFWATKLNVARGGRPADAATARQQLEASFRRIGKPVIDLIQVHNMGDVRTQLPILREYKEKGRVRHIGVTTTFEGDGARVGAPVRRRLVGTVLLKYVARRRASA